VVLAACTGEASQADHLLEAVVRARAKPLSVARNAAVLEVYADRVARDHNVARVGDRTLFIGMRLWSPKLAYG